MQNYTIVTLDGLLKVFSSEEIIDQILNAFSCVNKTGRSLMNSAKKLAVEIKEPITANYTAENLPADCEAVVYSSAVTEANPEFYRFHLPFPY